MDRVCAKLKLLDYKVFAPRILDGALADVLMRERAGVKEPESNRNLALDNKAQTAMNIEALQNQ